MKVIDNIKLLKINTSSFHAAVRDAKAMYQMSTQSGFDDLIIELVCEPLHSKSHKESELLFGFLIQETVREFNLGNQIEKEEAITIARQKTNDYLAKNPWCDPVVVAVQQAAVHEAAGTTAATPIVGRIKRGSGGSKKDRCLALYQANPKMERKDLIALFVTTLELSIPGATTYVYNCMKGIWK